MYSVFESMNSLLNLDEEKSYIATTSWFSMAEGSINDVDCSSILVYMCYVSLGAVGTSFALPALQSGYQSYLENSFDLAVKNGDEKEIKALLAQGVEPKLDNNADNSLSHAITHNHLGTLDLLLTHLAISPPAFYYFKRPFLDAIKGDHRQAIELLLDFCASDVNTNLLMEQGLVYASEYGHRAQVEFLLKRINCSDTSDNIQLAIIKAAQNGHLEIMKILLTANSDLTSETIETAISEATENQQDDMLNYLISQHSVSLKSVSIEAQKRFREQRHAMYIAKSFLLSANLGDFVANKVLNLSYPSTQYDAPLLERFQASHLNHLPRKRKTLY